MNARQPHPPVAERLRREIGPAIRTFRLDRGLTQSALSAGLCTKAAISAIENGIVLPSLPMLYALAERLDVPATALLP